MSEMACLEPEGLMEQELQYLSALSKAKLSVVEGGNLALLDENGSLLTLFVSRET